MPFPLDIPCASKKRHSRRHLLSMPEKVMLKIMEKSGYRSILTLRKVCRDFRCLIDDAQPEFNIEIVEVHINPDKIRIFLHDLASKKSTRIEYLQDENDVKLICGKKENVLKNWKLLAYFVDDMTRIFSFQHEPFSSFSLHCSEVPEELENFLRLEHLKTKCLSITTVSSEQVMKVLPYFNKDAINEICIFNSEDRQLWDMGAIMNLDQWKNSKYLEAINFIMDVPIQNFSRFINANISVKNISAESFIFLKDAFLKLPDFKHFNVQYENFAGIRNVCDSLGPAYFEDPNIRIDFGRWYFKIPNTDRVLLIVAHFAKHLQFSGLKMTDVPH